MGTTTIHPAESYLRNETNPSSLYVRIAGKRRRLFINRTGVLLALSRPAKGQKIMHSQIGQASSRYTIPRKNRRRIRTGNSF